MSCCIVTLLRHICNSIRKSQCSSNKATKGQPCLLLENRSYRLVAKIFKCCSCKMVAFFCDEFVTNLVYTCFFGRRWQVGTPNYSNYSFSSCKIVSSISLFKSIAILFSFVRTIIKKTFPHTK